EEALANELEGTEAVLIVDECRRSGNLSEALMTICAERLQPLPKIARVTAKDCFIPLGVASTVSLPSRESIAQAAKTLVQPVAQKVVKTRRPKAAQAKV